LAHKEQPDDLETETPEAMRQMPLEGVNRPLRNYRRIAEKTIRHICHLANSAEPSQPSEIEVENRAGVNVGWFSNFSVSNYTTPRFTLEPSRMGHVSYSGETSKNARDYLLETLISLGHGGFCPFYPVGVETHDNVAF
jgi:hypothetical protein